MVCVVKCDLGVKVVIWGEWSVWSSVVWQWRWWLGGVIFVVECGLAVEVVTWSCGLCG